MSKTKPPVYRGPRKNHASVFIGQRPEDQDYQWNRIRIFHSQTVSCCNGISKFEYRFLPDDDINYYIKPCYVSDNSTEREAVEGMETYDKMLGLKTVFLGYVKDCE